MERNISFSKREKITDNIIENLRSLGENTQKVVKLENALKERLNIKYALSTNNSTAALHLSMCALDLKRGDKVLCSVNSFVDVPEVVRHFDAEPIFVDIDPKTYNIDLNQLEEKLKKHKTKKLRAVIISHIAGLPVDMERVYELAKKYEIKVIEDCSDAFGAKNKGFEVGSKYCDIGVFSFGDKNDNLFSGGALTSNNQEYVARAELLRNHSIITQSVTANYLYDVVDIGCDYRMSEYDAVFANDILERIDAHNKREIEIANIYFKELEGLRHLSLPVKSPEHIYKYFIVEVDKNRDSFARELKTRGVEVSLHYVPLHSTKYYKDKYNLKIFDFPNAMSVYQRVMSLPNHPDLSDDDIYYVCEKIKEVDSIHI
jgi:dTDP-4-amino-4,6-dideoxygalactose transaminase